MATLRDLARAAGELVAASLVLPLAIPMWFAPLGVAIALGRLGGLVGFAVWGRARRAGMMNLRRADGLPAMTKAEARRAIRTVFCNMGRSIAEGINFSRVGAERFGLPVAVEDGDLARRLRDDPRPKIFVTGHLGSWEVALMLVRDVSGIAGSVIARGVDNRFLDALVRRVRFRSPDEWIEKHGAADAALAALRSGKSIAMLLDENGGWRGPFVPFFGRPASTRKTPALLSAVTGAPVVVGAAVRRGDSLLLRLAVVEPPADTSRERIVETTARITSILEQWIREDLLQWRWIHWRWRSRPDGREERYGAAELAACFAEEAARPAADDKTETP